MGRRFDFWQVVSSRLFLIAILGLITAVTFGLIKSNLRRQEVKREVSALQTDIERLRAKNEELKKSIDYFNTPEFKEHELRLRLGLQKPGEQVVIIPNLPNALNTTPTGNLFAPNPINNWQRWFNYFLHRNY